MGSLRCSRSLPLSRQCLLAELPFRGPGVPLTLRHRGSSPEAFTEVKPPWLWSWRALDRTRCPSSRPAGSAPPKSSSALGSNDPSVEAVSAGRVNGPASIVRPKRLCFSPSSAHEWGTPMRCVAVSTDPGARPSCLDPRAGCISPVRSPKRTDRPRSTLPEQRRPPYLGARKPLSREQRRGHRPPRLTAGGARSPGCPAPAHPDTLRRHLVTSREWVPLGVRPATEAFLRPKPKCSSEDKAGRVPSTTSRFQAGALPRASSP